MTKTGIILLAVFATACAPSVSSTATSLEIPTNTPASTNTIVPTETPLPTETTEPSPEPTGTPEPSPTVAADSGFSSPAPFPLTRAMATQRITRSGSGATHLGDQPEKGSILIR